MPMFSGTTAIINRSIAIFATFDQPPYHFSGGYVQGHWLDTCDSCTPVRRRLNSKVEYDPDRKTTVMRIEASKRLFNVDDYYRMAEVGILGPEDRVELIDGEIIRMSPIGTRHAGCVNRATRIFSYAFRGKAIVSVQNPLRLNNYTEPEPDLVLLKHRADDYGGKRMMAEDALLVLEVADTTLQYDRDVKVPRYAAAGIPEVWIEDLKRNRILVYRDPEPNGFRTVLTLKRGESLSILAFPETTFTIDELFTQNV